MFIARKARADAKLEQLRTDQRERLIGWLGKENRTYAEARALVQSEFGLAVGKTALGTFWRRYVLPQRLWEEAKAESPGVELPESAFPETVSRLARRHVMAVLQEPEPDVRTVRSLMSVVGMTERLTLDRRRAALEDRRLGVWAMRVKIEAMTDAVNASDRPLTPSEKQLAMIQLIETGEIPDIIPPDSPLLPRSAALQEEAAEDGEEEAEKRGD
ncbi:MAG TPA: hypothetical protein VGE76_15900 [Opitutaceae bacterium]